MALIRTHLVSNKRRRREVELETDPACIQPPAEAPPGDPQAPSLHQPPPMYHGTHWRLLHSSNRTHMRYVHLGKFSGSWMGFHLDKLLLVFPYRKLGPTQVRPGCTFSHLVWLGRCISSSLHVEISRAVDTGDSGFLHSGERPGSLQTSRSSTCKTRKCMGSTPDVVCDLSTLLSPPPCDKPPARG